MEDEEEEVVCWAEATPAARGAWRWMEPYQQEAPACGVVDKRLGPTETEMKEEACEESSGSSGVFVWLCCGGVASPGAVASVDAPGQVVVAVVSTRVVKEISPGAETVTVDHPSWSLWGEGG